MARLTKEEKFYAGYQIWKSEDCGAIIMGNKNECMFEVFRAEVGSYLAEPFHADDIDCNHLGDIWVTDRSEYDEMREALDAGHCPICERWEDGNGNVCSADGWAE